MATEHDCDHRDLPPVELYINQLVAITTTCPAGEGFQGVLVKSVDGWLLIRDSRGGDICINRQQVISVRRHG